MISITYLKTTHVILFVVVCGFTFSCSKSSGNDGGTPTPTNPKKTVNVPMVNFFVTNIYAGTNAPYVAAHDSIVAGYEVGADGGAPVTGRGVCWSTSQNPTIANAKTVDGAVKQNPVTGLTVNTTYYLRAYATNSAGTGYSSQISLTTQYIIGENFAGGTIFFVDTTNNHGLVVAQYARTPSIWGPSGFVGATSFFDGKANTDKIVAKYGANAQNAAALCRACRDGGYTDWFLPSLFQLEQLGAAPVGDIDWSSTEYSSGVAEVLSSPYQNTYGEAKNYKHPARPIRAF